MNSSFEQHPTLVYPAVECGLTVEQAFSLRECAGGFLTIRQLDTQSIKPSDYALGLNVPHYNRAVESFGLKNWKQAYQEVCPSGSLFFMDTFIEQGRNAYFFVPREVLAHRRANFTRSEMLWCLDHLNQIQQIQFVFGLYDLSLRNINSLTRKK